MLLPRGPSRALLDEGQALRIVLICNLGRRGCCGRAADDQGLAIDGC